MTVASRRAKRAHGGSDRALYVEILIEAPLETVWELTQEPASHVRWDARFTSILPERSRDDGAEEFRYELALGIHPIRGTGVSLGSSEGLTGYDYAPGPSRNGRTVMQNAPDSLAVVAP